MKTSIFKTKGKVLTLILALFGVSACDTGMCAYGTPTADYKISGRVTNKQNEPIQGIQVKLPKIYPWELQPNEENPTTLTDENGNYSFDCRALPTKNVDVEFSDIDAKENGSYKDATKSVAANYKGGDGGWYEGTADLKIDATLTEKKY